jgi:hypothetical protein
MTTRNISFFVRILLVASILSLIGCGGGGSSNAGTPAGSTGGGTGGGTSGGARGGGGTNGGGTGAGGSTGVGASADTAVPQAQLGPGLGQALLGPIVDATVEVYGAENFSGALVCSVTTSSGDAPEGPGVIDLSACPISESSVYLLVVEGGMDIDADDDEVIDAAPTAKRGSLRAIISGQEILAGDFRINIVTEIAYQSISDALLGGAGQSEIVRRLDGVARQLLSEDLNGDGIVDNQDLLDFSPVDQGSFIAGAYADLLDDILAAILSGDRQELTKLSRQLLLASLGEYSFQELLSQGHSYQNLLIADFLVENGYIYAVGYDVGSPEQDLEFFVFDATDFSAVSLIGEYSDDNLPANPQNRPPHLVKVGDYVYMTSQGNGLFVIDVSDPTVPVGSLSFTASGFTGVSVKDESTIFISYSENPAAPDTGIHVVDISDPANPQIVSSTRNITVYGMLYESGFLYAYGPGIAVFDASSPTSLSLLGSVSFPTSSDRNISYRNGFVYAPITDADAGLQGMTIVDVRDPQNPLRIDDVSGIGFVRQIDIHEDTLYATTSTRHGASFMLTSFRIGADGKLLLIDSRSSPAALYLRYENDRVYLASSTDLTAYDANGLNNWTDHLGFIATDKAANLVDVVGTVAYVANDTELLSIDVSNPAGPLSVLDSVGVIDLINDMKIVGNYAYLANATEGIKVVDISDPTNLRVVGSNADLVPFYDPVNDQTFSQEAFAIAMQNNLAYTVIGGFPYVVIGVFDVSDPTAPTVVQRADFPFPLGDIAIDNNTLYGVDQFGSRSFYVIDAENEPRHLATMDLRARVLTRDGAYLYTTSDTAGLSILDISEERNPILFGSALSLGIGNAVSVVGDVAYVANEFGMVEVYDILDKTKPALIGQYPISGVVTDVFATDDYVYAVNGVGLVIEPAARLHSALE